MNFLQKASAVGLLDAISGFMKMNQIQSLRDKLSRKPFVVEYAQKRFLAYRDAAGRIRHFWKQTLLPVSVHILDPES